MASLDKAYGDLFPLAMQHGTCLPDPLAHLGTIYFPVYQRYSALVRAREKSKEKDTGRDEDRDGDKAPDLKSQSQYAAHNSMFSLGDGPGDWRDMYNLSTTTKGTKSTVSEFAPAPSPAFGSASAFTTAAYSNPLAAYLALRALEAAHWGSVELPRLCADYESLLYRMSTTSGRSVGGAGRATHTHIGTSTPLLVPTGGGLAKGNKKQSFNGQDRAGAYSRDHDADLAMAVGLAPGPHENTMRGIDPLSTELCRAMWDASRDRVAQWGAFACPDEAVLQAMARFTRLRGRFRGEGEGEKDKKEDFMYCELGAGTGYWAGQLRRCGVKVEAYDIQPTGKGGGKSAFNSTYGLIPFTGDCCENDLSLLSVSNNRQDNNERRGSGANNAAPVMNDYHGSFPLWTYVGRRGVDSLPRDSQHALQAAQFNNNSNNRNRGKILFLCYPPPDSQMGLNALRQGGWERVVYVGEIGGDTGTLEFEKALCEEFVCVSGYDQLPQWGNTAITGT